MCPWATSQRHTVYSHFPEERALYAACSGWFAEQHPMPDPSAWRATLEPARRVRQGLTEVYAYYQRNAEALTPIAHDVQVHPPTREFFELRFLPQIERIRTALAEPFRARGARRARLLAALQLALDFATWSTLSATLPETEIVNVAVRAVCAQ